MKNLLFILLVPIFCVAQSEQIASFTAGAGGGDFTNQPVGCQSEFSKTQTLYYPNEIQFKGTITEIRYKTSFDNISLANSNIWTVKIGTTTLAEFGAAIPFIDTNTLTTVFSGAITQTRAEVIISFSQPFFYNGTDNLVIEVSETAPGLTSSLISAFKGSENFGNPPIRSKVSFTGSTGGAILNENSYPTTQFIGTLERCIRPAYSGIQAAPSQTTATIVIENNQAVTGYNYVVYEKGMPMPSNLIPTVQNSIELANLLPAQEYVFATKTNCDTPINRFAYIGFSTKPLSISVPHSINFDATNTRDYIFSGGFIANASMSNKAGNNSANGILFRGSLDAMQANTWSDFDVWNTNSNFISQANFIIDLTNNPTNPVFTFDLKQKEENYFRVRINNIVKTWTFKSSLGGDVNFQKITIDLSEFIGQTINLDLQSLSKYTGDIGIRTAFVDNIELKSTICLAKENDFLTTSTENSITLHATDLSSNYEVAIVNQATELKDDIWTTVSLPYTFDNLTIAKAYKIFVRKICGNEITAFLELFESTKTTVINTPFSEAFNSGNFTTYFVPKFNNSSNVTINTVYNYVNLHQRENGKTWFGDLNTTDNQAWNENKILFLH